MQINAVETIVKFFERNMPSIHLVKYFKRIA
jgi:hypothetical protein